MLHGKPANWKPRSNRPFRANSVVVTDDLPATESNPFSKDQLDLLHKLIGQPPDPTATNTTTSLLAQQGNSTGEMVDWAKGCSSKRMKIEALKCIQMQTGQGISWIDDRLLATALMFGET